MNIFSSVWQSVQRYYVYIGADIRLLPLVCIAIFISWIAVRGHDSQWGIGIGLICVLFACLLMWHIRKKSHDDTNGSVSRYSKNQHIFTYFLLLAGVGGAVGSVASIHSYVSHPRILEEYAQKKRHSYAHMVVASRPVIVESSFRSTQEDETCMSDLAIVEIDAIMKDREGFIYNAQRRANSSSFSFKMSSYLHQLGLHSVTGDVIVRGMGVPCEAKIGQHIVMEGVWKPYYEGKRQAATFSGATVDVFVDGLLTAHIVDTYTRYLEQYLSDKTVSAQALIPGVALGDDSYVSDSLEEAMQLTGMTHLIAVSGSHVSIIIAAIFFLFRKRRRMYVYTLIVCALIALIFFVSPHPSVMRAVVMGIFLILAMGAKRKGNAGVALLVGVLLLCFIDPYTAVSFGFLLSALATASIIYIALPLSRAFANRLMFIIENTKWSAHLLIKNYFTVKKLEYVSLVIFVPFVAQLACIPVLLLFTSESSLWAACANICVSFVVTPLTVCALLGMFLLPFQPVLAKIILFPADVSARWIARVAFFFAQLPGSGVSHWLVLCVYFAVIMIAVFFVAGALYRSFIMLIALVLTLIGTYYIYGRGQEIDVNWEEIVCDVGQGSAFLMRADETVIMVDVGNESRKVLQCLRQAHVDHIDTLILSHFHDDHMGSIKEVLEEVSVSVIWASEDKEPNENYRIVSDAARQYDIPLLHVKKGQKIRSRNGHTIGEIIWPKNISGDPNGDSLVVRFDDNGGTLVMGDVGKKEQNMMLSSVDEVSTIIVSHHGSADQSAPFATRVNAKKALISVGENSYGHPSKKVKEYYSYAKMEDTLTCGSIVMAHGEIISQCP